MQNNLLIHADTKGKYAAAIARDPNARYVNNVVCDWGKTDFETPEACAKPARSVATYFGAARRSSDPRWFHRRGAIAIA